MTAQAHISAEGQVSLPQDVLDRLAWQPGTTLEVVETADGITLRRTVPADDREFQAALARLRATVSYDGPPGYDADWNAAIGRMFEQGRMFDTE